MAVYQVGIQTTVAEGAPSEAGAATASADPVFASAPPYIAPRRLDHVATDPLSAERATQVLRDSGIAAASISANPAGGLVVNVTPARLEDTPGPIEIVLDPAVIRRFADRVRIEVGEYTFTTSCQYYARPAPGMLVLGLPPAGCPALEDPPWDARSRCHGGPGPRLGFTGRIIAVEGDARPGRDLVACPPAMLRAARRLKPGADAPESPGWRRRVRACAPSLFPCSPTVLQITRTLSLSVVFPLSVNHLLTRESLLTFCGFTFCTQQVSGGVQKMTGTLRQAKGQRSATRVCSNRRRGNRDRDEPGLSLPVLVTLLLVFAILGRRAARPPHSAPRGTPQSERPLQ